MRKAIAQFFIDFGVALYPKNERVLRINAPNDFLVIMNENSFLGDGWECTKPLFKPQADL